MVKRRSNTTFHSLRNISFRDIIDFVKSTTLTRSQPQTLKLITFMKPPKLPLFRPEACSSVICSGDGAMKQSKMNQGHSMREIVL